MGFTWAFKRVKIFKNPGNGRLNNLNDPVLNVLILVATSNRTQGKWTFCILLAHVNRGFNFILSENRKKKNIWGLHLLPLYNVLCIPVAEAYQTQRLGWSNDVCETWTGAATQLLLFYMYRSLYGKLHNSESFF